jgi:hypothetical protein
LYTVPPAVVVVAAVLVPVVVAEVNVLTVVVPVCVVDFGTEEVTVLVEILVDRIDV